VVFLLLINVADLKPDVGVSQWTRRISQNAVETDNAVVVLALLLVDDAEAEKDLVFFIKI
jgi:hypothetical protein